MCLAYPQISMNVFVYKRAQATDDYTAEIRVYLLNQHLRYLSQTTQPLKQLKLRQLEEMDTLFNKPSVNTAKLSIEAMTNYYNIISEKVFKHVIDAAYKALVKKYHPDMWTGKEDIAEKSKTNFDHSIRDLNLNREQIETCLL